jgi:hypothetical protein
MRAAGMALPHEHPKLAVTAMIDGNNDFAAQLDRAVLCKNNRPAARLSAALTMLPSIND